MERYEEFFGGAEAEGGEAEKDEFDFVDEEEELAGKKSSKRQKQGSFIGFSLCKARIRRC